MRINTNVAALNGWRNLNQASGAVGKSLEKLSSGFRINRAGDDAAGLAISEKMRGQIRGLEQASRNAQDGISLLQTAEGALNETHSILQRMRELSVQSSNDTATDADRTEMQKEITQLKSEIDRISTTTEFNTKKLLDGSLETSKTLQGTELKSVAVDSGTLGTTLLTALEDADGNSFGLVAGDVITISGNINGTAISAGNTLTIAADSDVADLMGQIETAFSLAAGSVTLNANKEIVIAGDDGTANALSNVKFEVDNRALFNNKMSSMEETQAAADTHVDSSLSMHIGANEGQTMKVDINEMSVQSLSLSSVDVSTQQGAETAQTVIQNAIETVSAERSKLGSFQNRLEHSINNLGTSAENITAAESRIRDADMAKEMMQFTKNNILTQAGTAMLAQANQAPQQVLQLLR